MKSHVLRCVVRARQRGIRAHQLMGQLPLPRVTPSRAFTHTGIDYAGPLTLKTWKGRGAKTHKGWICVFVCLTTSAVHLEVVSDYSTEGFISTYKRFVSRRGIPHSLYSDCGTNFVGADTWLKVLFTQISQKNQRISSLLAQDRTQWNFNPPSAPHMGGKWEAVVKSLKHHLRRTIGETLRPTWETQRPTQRNLIPPRKTLPKGGKLHRSKKRTQTQSATRQNPTKKRKRTVSGLPNEQAENTNDEGRDWIDQPDWDRNQARKTRKGQG